jgi:hypothetical protein
MFLRLQPSVVIAASLTLGGLVLGTWAIAKDETSQPVSAVAPHRQAVRVQEKDRLAKREDSGKDSGKDHEALDGSPDKPLSSTAGKLEWVPQVQGPTLGKRGAGYGLHAGKSPAAPGHASIREASAAALAASSAGSHTLLSGASAGVLRPPLDNEPMRTGSLRADITRYSAERSGRGQGGANPGDTPAVPQSYAPSTPYRN